MAVRRNLGGLAACVLLPYFSKIMGEALQILAVEDEKAVAQILAVVLGGPMAKKSAFSVPKAATPNFGK